MEALRVVVASLLGLGGGWFALVLVDRVPDDLALWRPRPRVPFPRGLSRRDGVVYLISAGLGALAALRFDEVAPLLVYVSSFVVLLALSVIDLETYRLPDRITFVAVPVALAAISAVSVLVYDDTDPIVWALTGAGVYFGFLLLAHLVHRRGMGFGDVKLSFLLGLLVGWPAGGPVEAMIAVIWAMFIGFFLGSILGVVMLVVRRGSQPYPFGPFLVAGAILVMLTTPDLLPDPDVVLF